MLQVSIFASLYVLLMLLSIHPMTCHGAPLIRIIYVTFAFAIVFFSLPFFSSSSPPDPFGGLIWSILFHLRLGALVASMNMFCWSFPLVLADFIIFNNHGFELTETEIIGELYPRNFPAQSTKVLVAFLTHSIANIVLILWSLSTSSWVCVLYACPSLLPFLFLCPRRRLWMLFYSLPVSVLLLLISRAFGDISSDAMWQPVFVWLGEQATWNFLASLFVRLTLTLFGVAFLVVSHYRVLFMPSSSLLYDRFSRQTDQREQQRQRQRQPRQAHAEQPHPENHVAQEEASEQEQDDGVAHDAEGTAAQPMPAVYFVDAITSHVLALFLTTLIEFDLSSAVTIMEACGAIYFFRRSILATLSKGTLHDCCTAPSQLLLQVLLGVRIAVISSSSLLLYLFGCYIVSNAIFHPYALQPRRRTLVVTSVVSCVLICMLSIVDSSCLIMALGLGGVYAFIMHQVFAHTREPQTIALAVTAVGAASLYVGLIVHPMLVESPELNAVREAVLLFMTGDRRVMREALSWFF